MGSGAVWALVRRVLGPLVWHPDEVPATSRAAAIYMISMATIRTQARHRLAWLLVPVLLLAFSGGRICWCHGTGVEHSHGADSRHASAPHDHGAGASEHHGHPGPAHDHDSPGDGCHCVGSNTPATEVPKGTAAEKPGFSNVATGGISFPTQRLIPSRVAVQPSWAMRAHAPPLFVVNCTYRC